MVYGVDYVGTFVGCVPRIRRQRLKMPLSAIAYVVSQRMVKVDIWEGLPHILIIIIDFKVWAFRLLYHSNPCVTQINGSMVPIDLARNRGLRLPLLLTLNPLVLILSRC
jgi:hypothetical protein